LADGGFPLFTRACYQGELVGSWMALRSL